MVVPDFVINNFTGKCAGLMGDGRTIYNKFPVNILHIVSSRRFQADVFMIYEVKLVSDLHFSPI